MKERKKPQVDRNAVFIRQRRADLEKGNRNFIKLNVRNMCECRHSNNGTPTIVSTKRKSIYSGNSIFTCTQCKKDLDIGTINSDDFEKAVDYIDRVLDLLKMTLLSNANFDDPKLAKRIFKTQLFLNMQIKDLFKLLKVPNKNNNYNRNNRDDRNIGGRPISR